LTNKKKPRIHPNSPWAPANKQETLKRLAEGRKRYWTPEKRASEAERMRGLWARIKASSEALVAADGSAAAPRRKERNEEAPG
jgi:hypothetical protein